MLVPEGILTWVKVFVLMVGYFAEGNKAIFLSLVLVMGLLSAHLPDEIKKRRLFRSTVRMK
jgi:hypothetical protein